MMSFREFLEEAYEPKDKNGNLLATDHYPFGFHKTEYGDAVKVHQFIKPATNPSPWKSRSKYTHATLHTNQLRATQVGVNHDFANKHPKAEKGRIEVTRNYDHKGNHDGTYTIINGHHRAIANIARGVHQHEVKIIEDR